MIVTFIVGAISLGMVFLYGCVGEIITEKAGHLNLGIPGVMCLGTAGGTLGASMYMSMCADKANPSYLLLLLFCIVFAAVFGAFGGLIYAFLTVSLRCNQNITGLALTTFGAGLTQYMITSVDKTYLTVAARTMSQGLPFAQNLGWFGQIFLSHSLLTYLAIGIAVATGIVLKRTRLGLELRAVGENPATADAAGINVTAYKYGAILIGSAVAGLGGLFYSMDYMKGSLENVSTIQAFGWLSIALVIFTLWRPILSVAGSIVFGGLYILAAYITGISFAQMKLLTLIPYVVTVIVLIVTSIFNSKKRASPCRPGSDLLPRGQIAQQFAPCGSKKNVKAL